MFISAEAEDRNSELNEYIDRLMSKVQSDAVAADAQLLELDPSGSFFEHMTSKT